MKKSETFKTLNLTIDEYVSFKWLLEELDKLELDNGGDISLQGLYPLEGKNVFYLIDNTLVDLQSIKNKLTKP